MTLFHAVVQIEHHVVRVLQFDSEEFRLRKITVHRHDTAWNAGGVSSEQAFFADVCDSLEDMSMVLVAGVEAAQAGLRRYVGSSDTALLARIIGWETIDPSNEVHAPGRGRASAAGSADERRGRRRRRRSLPSSA